MPQDKLKAEEYAMMGGINSKVSQYTQGPHEFLDLVNMNFSRPGALTKRSGSTLYMGATVIGQITGLAEYQRLNGFSQIIFTANTNAYYIDTNTTPQVFKTGLASGSLFSFQTFVDRIFCVSGSEAFKYDGTNNTPFSLPPGITGYGATAVIGGALSGTYFISYGYYNDRGYFGPPGNTQVISLNGSTFGSIQFYGLTTPSGFGISGIAFYESVAGGVNLFQKFTSGITTAITDTGVSALTNFAQPAYLWFTNIPKYLSLYNNQMIYSGFSNLLSTVYFSDIGEPEGVKPEYFFEVRTNDSDRITGTIPYNGTLLVFKERSFHRLTGSNPNNFTLNEVSDQYGCLSNRAAVVWENVAWFLDRKGIVEYIGSNLRIVSNKVEPIFTRMNIDAAKDQAIAVHDRLRNQVKFSIPVDGSTINNITVVYDYIAESWTTEKGYLPAVNSVARGRFSSPTVLYGGYTGSIHYFGSSLFGDNAQSMTCLIKTRFLADLGNSVEKQFRRLFLDVVPLGTTSAVKVNFFQDYGSSIVLTNTMYQAPFQSRIDYGIMAKSMALEITQTSNTDPFQVNGYTIEYRLQRRV